MREGQINQAGEGPCTVGKPCKERKGAGGHRSLAKAGGWRMKEAAGRKARCGGHTADNDHQIYRMLSLCPPLIRGTIPPWVLL